MIDMSILNYIDRDGEFHVQKQNYHNQGYLTHRYRCRDTRAKAIQLIVILNLVIGRGEFILQLKVFEFLFIFLYIIIPVMKHVYNTFFISIVAKL